MKRLALSVLIALSALLLVLPASADPIPESAEEPSAEGVNSGVRCGGSVGGSRSRPVHAVVSGNDYLSSVFRITCEAAPGYTLIRFNIEGKYGASPGGGEWSQYSNDSTERGMGGEGSLEFDPLRDGCHWGGDWNYYRQSVWLETTARNNASGIPVISRARYLFRSESRIPCGDHE